MSTGPRSNSTASVSAGSSGGGTVWPISSATDPRAALAPAERQRHTELIRQSHERCAALGLMRIEQPDYTPLLKGDLNMAIERNQRLLTHATPVMELLFDQIVDTQSMIVLTDCQGTILHALGDDEFLGRASKVALVPGVNWSEQSKGTNGMGTTLFSEAPTLVHADEHFMHANGFLTCSASPIFDPRGNILGVLDVTSDHRAYHRHTMGLVRMSARMIENHWLTEDFRSSLRLHFHPRPDFIGSLLEGIAVLNPEGRFLGANRSALDLLDLQGSTLRMRSLASVFGVTVNALADHFRSPLADPMKLDLPSGRSVYVEARFGWARLHTLRQAASADTLAVALDAPLANPPVEDPARERPPGDPERATGPHSLRDLRTGDPQMDTVIDKVQRILDRDITLLLLGEKGTGKELLARAFHHDSARAAKPFVPVDCASIPQTLLEAELLGYADSTQGDALHEKTAGSAHQAPGRTGRVGRIVQAHGGTLFLNEIGDLPLPLQARLLRVLRDRCVYPLGADQPVPVDIAVIAATDRNLREMIERGEFREDLYYRLNGLVVRLPPLRERIDLLAIAQRMLKRESPRHPPALGAGVVELFQAYHWPGNLRQLGSVLRTAVAMAENDAQITEAHLSDDLLEETRGLLLPHVPVASFTAPVQPAALPQAAGRQALRRAAEPGGLGGGSPITRPLEEVELEMIRQAVEAAGGNISMASKRLGISRNTIYRKLRWKQS